MELFIMKYTPKVKIVESNSEKGETITKLIKKYNLAYKNEFYFECLWILYTIIEDRTSAFFYHLGFVNGDNRNKVTGSKYKQDVRTILNMNIDDTRYGFDKLSGKLNNIEKVINWSFSGENASNLYQKDIKRIITKYAEYDDIQSTINYLQEDWRNIRNELTHGLCRKNMDSVNSNIKELIDNGYISIRKIDKLVSGISRNHLRKKYKIQ